jgi:hypothetical protein
MDEDILSRKVKQIFKALLVLGIVLFIVSSFWQALLLDSLERYAPIPFATLSEADQKSIATYILNFCNFLIPLGLTAWILDFLQNNFRRGRVNRFKLFFGPHALSSQVRIMQPTRKGGGGFDVEFDEFRRRKFDEGRFWQRTWSWNPEPKSVSRWLAEEDTYAGIKVMQMVSEFARESVRFTFPATSPDSFQPYPIICLGLGFSEGTYRLERDTRGVCFRVIFPNFDDEICGSEKRHVEEPHVPTNEAKSSRNNISDDIAFPMIADKSKDGGKPEEDDSHEELVWGKFTPPVHHDLAVVVRHPRQLPNDSYSTTFLLAGRRATGTAAAGAFLNQNWNNIYKLYCEYAEEKRISYEEALRDYTFVGVLVHKVSTYSNPFSDGSDSRNLSGIRFFKGDSNEPKRLNSIAAQRHTASDQNECKCYCEKVSPGMVNESEIRAYAESLQKNGYGFIPIDAIREPEPKTGSGLFHSLLEKMRVRFAGADAKKHPESGSEDGQKWQPTEQPSNRNSNPPSPETGERPEGNPPADEESRG